MKDPARVALVGSDGRRVDLPVPPERLERTHGPEGERLTFVAHVDDRLEEGVETTRAIADLAAMAGDLAELHWGARRFAGALAEVSISETAFAADLRPIAATIRLGLDLLGDERAIAVTVAGARWSPIRDLREAGPDDRAYEVRVEEHGSLSVRFGDGKHGARPPSGEEVVVRTRYRVAGGSKRPIDTPLPRT